MRSADSSPQQGTGMDEDDIEAFARVLVGPGRAVALKDRLRSRAWICSSSRIVVKNAEEIPVPAPCAKCGGIAFETIEPPLQ